MSIRRRTLLRLVVVLMLAWLATPQVPPAHASQTVNLTPTEVQITSDASTFSTGEINQYDCLSSYPHLVNWKDNSSGGTAFTYSEWSSGGSGTSDDPDWVKVHFGAIGTASDGIISICSSQWPPTTADCGGESQPDCWGAVQGYAPGTPKQGWMRSDFMFFSGGSGLCDHALYGATDYTCKSAARHQLDSNSWEHWAIDNQRYGVSAKEPMNWFTTLGTHESFNTRADTYTFPNQQYSISDQLTAGARYIDLRGRWSSGYLRLSHTSGNDSTSGAAAGDRAFPYALEEIGTWLGQNPTEVIRLDIGVGTSGAAADSTYYTDPIEKYLSSAVLTPSAWCHYLHDNYPTIARPYPTSSTPDDCSGVDAGGDYVPYRWPTMNEMHALGKQLIITTNGGSLGSGWTFDLANTTTNNSLDGQAGYTNGFARQFDGTQCTRNGVTMLSNPASSTYSDAQWKDYYNRATTTEEEARVFGEETFSYSSWTGYLVANSSDISTLGSAAVVDGNQATSMEAVTNCNVSLMKLDMFGADQYFESQLAPVSNLTNRLDGAIWSWANGDYGTGGGGNGNDCAVLGGSDNKWHSRACGEVHHFACALPRSGDPTTWTDALQKNWRVTTGTGTWSQGEQVCDQEFGTDSYVFSSPRNGYANQQLIAQRSQSGLSGTDLWLAYSDAGSGWHAGAPPLVHVTATTQQGGQPYAFSSWTNQDVSVTLSAVSKADASTSITQFRYSMSGAQTASGAISGTSATLTVGKEGITTVTVQATDSEGNISPSGSYVIKIDKTAPALGCGRPDSKWHSTDVHITCAANDGPTGSGLANAADSTFTLNTSVSAGSQTTDAQTDSHQVCDSAGNCSTAGPYSGIKIDEQPPIVACGAPASTWHSSDVHIACAAGDGTTGSGLANQADSSFTLSTSVPAGTQTSSASTGSHKVCDSVGNCSTAGPYLGIKIDEQAPGVSCGSADGQWHGTDVHISCSASDGPTGSGLANAADSSFTLSTSVPAGTQTSSAATGSQQVCDAVGNCVLAGPITNNRVDEQPPVTGVTLSPAPDSGGLYHGAVQAAFSATDGVDGSTVSTSYYSVDDPGCTPVARASAHCVSFAHGDPNDASASVSTLGQHTLTYFSVDRAGNLEAAHSTSFTLVTDTSIAVSSSQPGGSRFGQPVTFTALVSAALPGAGAPNGTVTFHDGLGGSVIGQPQMLVNGAASVQYSGLSVGTHSISVVYSGSSNSLFQGSQSALLAQVVLQAVTSTTVMSSNSPALAGQKVVLQTTVGAVAPGVVVPSGTVTFQDGGTPLGTVTLQQGKASLNLAGLGRGMHAITVRYSGDSNALSSTSAPLSQQVYGLTATGVSLSARTGSALSGVQVASFSDDDPNPALHHYTASINWGDGSTGSGAISATGSSSFAVRGSHTYASAGQRGIVVSITAADGRGIQVTDSVTVSS